MKVYLPVALIDGVEILASGDELTKLVAVNIIMLVPGAQKEPVYTACPWLAVTVWESTDRQFVLPAAEMV